MKKKQDEFVGIKLNKVDLINIDSHAESKWMNRSEFIKHCIFQELERTQNEAAVKVKQGDNERLIAAIVECSKTSSMSYEKLLTIGIIIAKLQRALITVFPERESELYKIFSEKKHA